jgi:dihydroorotate dehydrogenase
MSSLVRRATASLIARASLPILTRLDPEFAHRAGLAGLRSLRPLFPPLQLPQTLRVSCLGLEFAHPVGLAAGFDKNGDYLDALGAVGFSHVELGTVTPRPQPGNPKPRMFRIAPEHALINRMGFNNKGVDHLLQRLSRSTYRGVRGISIGKNFDTPLELAHQDYVHCMRKVYEHAHYIAVNISSPNTARLRELQSGDGLQRILGALLEERENLRRRFGTRVPLLVKVAPDLDAAQISALAHDLRALEIDGVIATNTTTDHSLLKTPLPANAGGGLSGLPLHLLSMSVITQLRAALGAAFPIIGVGGIVDARGARASLRAGATLLQVYTGFAYRGAALLDEILQDLSA